MRMQAASVYPYFAAKWRGVVPEARNSAGGGERERLTGKD
jgi:hypothetical protein